MTNEITVDKHERICCEMEAAQYGMVYPTELKARIAELEAVITKALKHADENGMKDWPVFKAMRKVLTKSAL